MLSTTEKELVHLDNGCFTLEPKELPNYCGIKDIGFVYHNEWADPELEYKGKRFNVHDVENVMWGYFVQEENSKDQDAFAVYMKNNADEVRELCEEAIA
jgi:hypothetical protein